MFFLLIVSFWVKNWRYHNYDDANYSSIHVNFAATEKLWHKDSSCLSVENMHVGSGLQQGLTVKQPAWTVGNVELF